MKAFIDYWLYNRFFVLIFIAFIIGAGVMVAPFDWQFDSIERSPIPVDAIPDISENQQIIFTQWPGRSPSDIDDQVTYPLTVSLLGLPGVKTVRSYSNFGFSMIYVIFEEDIEFYWSRSRILEKLNSLPAGTLPEGVVPSLGPDATALGQVFWYTLEGRDKHGNPTGGWDLDELRSIQDWVVRYALMSANGVSEVASVGGFVKEYQIDVDPDAMRAYGVSIEQIFNAIRSGNSDVSARTIEVNNVEYMIRGVGFIDSVEDLEQIAIISRQNTPVRIQDVAHISLGPALRRGVLDKAGTEAVGGVAVVRFGDNPLQVIKNIKTKIDQIAPGLPEKTLSDGTVSKVTIVPFYDRTELIYETLNTLNEAIEQQVLITLLVVLVMVFSIRSGFIIGLMLPLTVLMTFSLMKLFKVDANVVALSGIAIAVGTIVDMGIVLCENCLRHLQAHGAGSNRTSRLQIISKASHEVAGPVTTAALTTIVSFLPVFTMVGAEGKLFTPLAFTKTFALICAIVLSITVLPTITYLVYGKGSREKVIQWIALTIAAGFSIYLLINQQIFPGVIVLLITLLSLGEKPLQIRLKRDIKSFIDNAVLTGIVLVIALVLSSVWSPLGPARSALANFVFVALTVAAVIGSLKLFQHFYEPMLWWALRHRGPTLAGSLLVVLFGVTCWLGFESSFRWLPGNMAQNETLNEAFPGIGKEFMPALDEGSFLYMPTTMPHASLSEVTDILQKQDMAIQGIPEVKTVVGKLGRAESPLDSAPVSMIETLITYHPEWRAGANGERGRFRYDETNQVFVRDSNQQLIEDPEGRYYRNWRDHIRNPDDIWQEIVKAAQIPGTTSAPKLQPIETRIVMLQSGFRAPMGVKVYGPTLEAIESFSQQLETTLKQVPGIKADTVFADRIVGKPYLEIHIDRERIARYGIALQGVQKVIEVAIGGKRVTTTVEGRERYPVRVRYMRELRDQIESLGDILIASPDGVQVPLRELANIRYSKGPQVIKSEDTFLVGYVIFDREPELAEVTVVERAQQFLQKKINSGDLAVPAGISYRFSGSYENQLRAQKTLTLVLPIALALIFVLLYAQFRSFISSLIVFYSVFIAWSGGFVLLWLYGKPWFLDFSVFDLSFREIFNIQAFNLSIAVWVGFLALFGIATDNGVILASRISQQLGEDKPGSSKDRLESIVAASRLRVRACLMTTATTLIALLPIFTSQGRGSDIMIPMAIPSMGGMLVVLMTLFVVPVLFSFPVGVTQDDEKG